MSAEASAPADPVEGSPAGSAEPDRAADAGAETLAPDSSIPGTGRGDSAPDEDFSDDAAVEEALQFALDTFLLDLSDDEGDDEGAVDAVLHEVLREALREGTVEDDEAVADAGDRDDRDGVSEACRRMILELDAALHFAGASDDDTLGASVDVALDELVDAVLGEYCNTVGRMMFDLAAAMRGAGACEEDYLGAAVDDRLDALLDEFGPPGPSKAERKRAAAIKIQAVVRGVAARARAAEVRAENEVVRLSTRRAGESAETVSREEASSSSRDPSAPMDAPLKHPRVPSAPMPANKSVRRRLERSGVVFAEPKTTSPPPDPDPALGFISSLDAKQRARLYRKIDLAFAFDLQGGSVLEGPDDRDEDGASRATEESDAGTSPERRDGDDDDDDDGDGDDDDASTSPSHPAHAEDVRRSPQNAFQASQFFPNLLEDSFDDGERTSAFPSPRAAKPSPRGEKSHLLRAAFLDVGPELDPDADAGTRLEKRTIASRGVRGRGFGESSVERQARENELRWRKERREREKRKLEDERRRFEVLQLELEAIEMRRREQARAREDKKAAEAELRAAREENKKLERRVREERLAWENQGKKLMAEQMERRRGGFPGASASGRVAFAKRDPLYVRMRKAFEEHEETEAEETRRRALEERRARKTGGGADGSARKSRFQAVFEATRAATLGRDQLDETALLFLPPLARHTASSDASELEQAAARFVRQRRYGQIVKQLHAPRVDPDARLEIARRADATRPGFENLSALVPAADPSESLFSPSGKPVRVYDERGVGRYATAKKTHVPYRYDNETAFLKNGRSAEYDIDGRRVRRDAQNDDDGGASRRDGPFGPFPKSLGASKKFSPRGGGRKTVPKEPDAGGFRSGQRALSRTLKARRDAANAAMARASRRDDENAGLNDHSSLVLTATSPYARLEARDPRYDARRDKMIGFDPRIDDEDGSTFLETTPPETDVPTKKNAAAPSPSPRKKEGKGFRTLLRERQLAAIEARAAAKERELAESETNDEIDSSSRAPRRDAYASIDDIPCVGSSTFGRTEGLAGLEDAENDKKDSLDGSEPPADGEEEAGGGDDDDDDDDGVDDDDDDDDDEEEEEEED